MANHEANPAPMGLAALAVAVFGIFALDTGLVDTSAIPLLAIFFFAGFIVQLFTGLKELEHGSIAGGNVFCIFGCLLLLALGMELMFKYFAGIHGWGYDSTIDGWLLLPITIILIGVTPAFFKSPLSLVLVLIPIDIALIFLTLIDLHVLSHHFHMVTGIILLISGIFALYTLIGITLNTVYNRTILPLGPKISKS